jgi:hypothetical protein
MPRVRLEDLEGEALSYARLITRSDGSLRASKPDLRKGDEHRRAAYVWRMVAFSISPLRHHQCMPVCAEFDLPTRCGEEGHRDLVKHLDAIADAITNTVPKVEWHGVIRWGQAFGMVGAPRYNEEGAVIYR